jgi:peptide/nickel transport system permease protein
VIALTTDAPRAPVSSRRIARALAPIAILAIIAAAAPLLAPYDPNRQLDVLALRSQAPSFAHPFGTDSFGRDVLSRVLYGGRVSLAVSLASVVLGLVVGTLYGVCTAFAPRAVAQMLRRALDVALAVPRVLILLAVLAIVERLSIPALVVLIGLTGWFATGRQVADELDALRTREFALAARAAGVRTVRLVWVHLLPHLLPLLIVSGTFAVANTTGLEAGLSYLGLGVQAPDASWGTIINEGMGTIGSEWWLAVFPGIATVLAAVACNHAGDVLREHFAPAHVAEP